MNVILDRKDWRFLTLLILGIFVLLNTTIFIVLNGGRWFEPIDPTIGKLPEYCNDLNKVFGPAYMLGFFTIQTNIFVGLMLVILPFSYFSDKTQSWFVGSVSLITITFLVYWALLAPINDPYEWDSPYFVISNVFIHGINPLISFIVLFMIRKEIIINKRILGLCSLWIAIFYIYGVIFYGASSSVDLETGKIDGSTIYSFLDIQKLFFIDMSDKPILAIFLNLLVFIFSPFLSVLVSTIWLKALKIETFSKSYFNWIDIIKQKREYKKMQHKN